MKKKTVYAFVGAPSESTTYSQIVSGSDSEIEAELDSMMDLIDCQRQLRLIWMTAPVKSVSFDQVAAQFAKYMQTEANKVSASESVGARDEGLTNHI